MDGNITVGIALFPLVISSIEFRGQILYISSETGFDCLWAIFCGLDSFPSRTNIHRIRSSFQDGSAF